MTDTGKASRQQEDRIAKGYKGSRNVMSGAGWVRKADVRTDDFLIEAKLKMDPNAKSYSLRAEDLRKLTKQAIADSRIPVMMIDLAGHNYVVLRDDDFKDMIGLEDE